VKADRNDYFNKIFVGVLILHIILLYVMPGLKKILIEKPKVVRIRFGDNVDTVDVSPKKNIEKKKITKVVEEKKENIKNEIPKKIVEKVEPPKILQMTQSFDDLDILVALDSPREINKNSKDLKSKIIKISNIKDKNKITEIENRELNEITDNLEDRIEGNLDLVEVGIVENKSEKIVMKKNSIDGLEDTKWDNLMSEDNPSIVGPKSGLKVGSIDGKYKVIWDPSNKDPKYPLEAEKTAQTADVKIILDVDASGKVLRVRLIKTGVDIIDRAVESKARDWNIKLINNGTAISGSVMVEYKFKLKGRE
jgi:TonB family protein